MNFEKILKLLQSSQYKNIDEGATLLFNWIDKDLQRHFEGQWKLHSQEATDLSQLTMLKIIQKAKSVNDSRKFKSWCWTVAKNQARDYLRKVKREKDVIDFDSEKINEYKISNNTELIDDKKDCIREGFLTFSKKYPDRAYALNLQSDGFSIGDISTYLCRTPGAAKEYLSQCRKKLLPYIKHCVEIN